MKRRKAHQKPKKANASEHEGPPVTERKLQAVPDIGKSESTTSGRHAHRILLGFLNFIGRPDVFLAGIVAAPRIGFVIGIPVIVAAWIPLFFFAHVGLPASNTPYELRALCSFAFLLLENVCYAGLAWFISKRLGGTGTFKQLLVACAFAQLPYILIRTAIPGILVVSLIWSFLLSITAVQQATKLSWFKAFGMQLAFFGVAYVSFGFTSALVPAMLRPAMLAQKPHALLQKSAPDIVLRLAGQKEPIKLSSLRGKVVVLDFWATWCPPCRAALPMVSKLSTSLRGRGVDFYAIDSSDSEQDAVKYLKDNNIFLPLAMDNDGANARAMEARSIPLVLVIDKTGTVRAAHLGYSSNEEEALRMEITQALAQK